MIGTLVVKFNQSRYLTPITHICPKKWVYWCIHAYTIISAPMSIWQCIIFEKLMKCQQFLGKISTWSLWSFCFTQALGKKFNGYWDLQEICWIMCLQMSLHIAIYTLTPSMWRASKQFQNPHDTFLLEFTISCYYYNHEKEDCAWQRKYN